MSFGVRFGRLVRRYREAQGLTATELAEAALGDQAKRSRISELENGRVNNPQAPTIDKLALHLAIPQEEIDACRGPLETPGLPPNLLENLALRFGHDNPDAPPAELEAFLKEKAKDWQEMRARLEALAEADGRVANLVGAAEAAIEAGNFDEADEILSHAEEMQQSEHTLMQVRKQARIRATRAEAALLRGDADRGHAHFEAAAAFFDPFDRLEGASQRHDYFMRLVEHADRFGGNGHLGAVRLAGQNLTVYTRDDMPAQWAMTQNNLGNALRTLGERAGGQDGLKALNEAVAAFRSAREVCSRDEMPAQWAMTQNNLGTALWTLGERAGGEDGLKALNEAVTAYEAALGVLREMQADHYAALVEGNRERAATILGEMQGQT